ncbi:hypothetical protein P9112_004494 [Eukaryota sp. TZLM1-RC]
MRILEPSSQLTTDQELGVQQCLADGFSDKLFNTIESPKLARDVIYLLYRYRIFPADTKLVATDDRGHVIGVVLLGPHNVSILMLISLLIRLLFKLTLKQVYCVCRGLLLLERLTKSHSKGELPELSMISVRGDMTGCGVGSMLLYRVNELILSRKYPIHTANSDRMVLIAYEQNPAIKLYMRHGYSIVKRDSNAAFFRLGGEKYSTFVVMEKKFTTR